MDVQDISSTNDAFAAIKSDGTVVAWGDRRNGGDSSAVQDTVEIGSNLWPYASYVFLCEIDPEQLYCFVFVRSLISRIKLILGHSGWFAYCDEPLGFLEEFLQQLESHEFSICLSCISIFSCSSTNFSNTIQYTLAPA